VEKLTHTVSSQNCGAKLLLITSDWLAKKAKEALNRYSLKKMYYLGITY
jgi:hypothetical protein